MEDLKIAFAENLITLRKQIKLTQAELAERINYSDKAVSKWERGESIPDIAVLKTIADLFGVTVDFLITEHTDSEKIPEKSTYARTIAKYNKLIITVMPTVAIMLVATIMFVILNSAFGNDPKNIVYCFVFPLPVCALVTFILSAIWGNKVATFLFVSLFLWLIILDIFLAVGFTIDYYPLIFVIGIPAEAVCLMSFGIIRLKI